MRLGTKACARLTGALYLATLPLGVFGLMYVTSAPVVGGGNVLSHEAGEHLLRLGVATNVVGQLVFVVVVLLLYELLALVSRRQAVLMAVLALLSVPMALTTEACRLAAVRLLAGAGLGAFTSAQVQAQATLWLGLYRDGILIAEFFWGLWLLPLGLLVFRSGFLPRLVGLVVLIAGAIYVADCSVQLLLPDRIFPLGFLRAGELLLPLWLAVMGINVAKRDELISGRAAARAVTDRAGGLAER